MLSNPIDVMAGGSGSGSDFWGALGPFVAVLAAAGTVAIGAALFRPDEAKTPSPPPPPSVTTTDPSASTVDVPSFAIQVPVIYEFRTFTSKVRAE